MISGGKVGDALPRALQRALDAWLLGPQLGHAGFQGSTHPLQGLVAVLERLAPRLIGVGWLAGTAI
jgi:hypothetical protein